MNPAAMKHLREAAAALARRDLDTARNASLAAQAAAPELPDAPNLLGMAAFEAGDLAAAERAFRDAVRLNPRYASAWQNLGATLERAGRLGESADAAHRALGLARAVP